MHKIHKKTQNCQNIQLNTTIKNNKTKQKERKDTKQMYIRKKKKGTKMRNGTNNLLHI